MRKFMIRMLTAVLLIGMLCGCTRERAEETVQPSVPLPVETTIQTEIPTEPSTCPPTEPPVETEPPTEPEPVAELISEGVQFLIDGSDCSKVLTDNNIKTLKHIYNVHELVIESEMPFSSLYLEWNRIPGNYTLVWDGGSLACGQYGFLHEYIHLPEAVNRVQFVFDDSVEYRMLCSACVLTAGTAPEGIQDWLPPCEEADILVFPTHADDDVLFFGPLISYYAIERQLKVQTAFMVDHVVYPERGHERLNGLWEMGVRHYPILGKAPDTPMKEFGEAVDFYAASKIEQWQVEQIRRFRPLVVVGHDLGGEYGNGGHKVNAFYLVRAVESAADPAVYPELAEQYGVWDTPKLYLHLYPENEIILDVETPLENDPLGRTPFEIAEDAFLHHKSQIQYYFRVQYGENRQYDCRLFGLYRTLVGYDTVADIMENIDYGQWRIAEQN